jgi:hypothetical protein
VLVVALLVVALLVVALIGFGTAGLAAGLTTRRRAATGGHGPVRRKALARRGSEGAGPT